MPAVLPVLVAVLAALLAVTGDARAAASDWVENDHARVRLVAASESVGGETLHLGLEMELAKGWKTYWRSPGDAGYPPRLDWSGSENLDSTRRHWPVPHRFQLFGLQTFGYKDRVILPVTATVADPGEPVTVNAAVDYLVCADTCIPHTAELSLTLPPGEGAPSDHAHAIDRFRARVPGLGAGTGMDVTAAKLSGTRETPELTVAVAAQPPLESPDAVVEGLETVEFGPPDVSMAEGGERAVLRLPAKRVEKGAELAGKQVTLTVFDGDRGLEREVTLERGEVPVAAGGAGGSGSGAASSGSGPGGGATAGEWLAMLGLALAGGLILNLMPCVLPVLSLKVLSVVGQGGRAPGAVRASFLASAAGIVVSFWVLAAAAGALKAAGMAVGWGIQFQQPLFLVAMVVIVTLFAANLAGFFEIRLPGAVTQRADAAARKEGHLGHFLTGAFATLLATPCSAPFLGTAVAFALSRGWLEIGAIFTALGVGLALPYLAVAAVPGAATRMPRPGRWMLRVKQVLAVALAATGVWLLTVLAAQAGTAAAVAVGGAMVLATALLWARPHVPGAWRRAVPVAVLALAVAAFAAPRAVETRQAAQPAETGAWQPLDRERIDALVDQGQTVFVDVTAEWCITCQVNKVNVIKADAVQARLGADSVTRMRGDWTSRSDRIADYLADNGRYGIPFNAVYGPNAPDGIVLPELLTRSAVLDAIEKAGRG
ncbi:protein-disulfide reductase DsbD family protein [Limimonas halophila]|nr:protein-disulfide reductase DsbD domain-containing protein [Limimonas halophila]